MYTTPRHDVNYPFLGALQAVAPGRALAALGLPTDLPHYLAADKLALAPWNSLLIVLLANLYRSTGVRRPRTRALWAWVLPWAWVGGLYFGQIDALPSALQLAAMASAGRFVRASPRGAASAPWLAAALVCAQLSLLGKQLALFAAPSVFALAALGIHRWQRDGRRGLALLGALSMAGSFALLRVPDVLLRLPAGWQAHVAYVYTAAGPPHGSMMGNAPGVWSYLGLAPDAPSDVPLAYGVTPRALGLGLFLAVGTTVTLASAEIARRRLRAWDTQGLLALALVHGGLVALSAAVLLAGAHERYLYPAWALLLPGVAVSLPRREAVTWFIAAVYGLFVLSTLSWEAFVVVFPLRSTQLVATLSLGLLAVLTADLVRHAVASDGPTAGESVSSGDAP